MTDRLEQPTDPHKSGAMQRADMANGEGSRDDTVVASTQGGDGTSAPPRVLLAADNSDHSLRAAKAAHQLFGNDAKYFVINVGPMDVMMPGGGAMTWGVPYPMAMPMVMPAMAAVPYRDGDEQGSDDSHRSDIPTAVDRAEAEARSVTEAAALPSDAVAMGATGDPVEQICLAAADERIDVIVVGSSSGGWWRHLLDPSVSKSVVRHADRPVLIIP